MLDVISWRSGIHTLILQQTSPPSLALAGQSISKRFPIYVISVTSLSLLLLSRTACAAFRLSLFESPSMEPEASRSILSHSSSMALTSTAESSSAVKLRRAWHWGARSVRSVDWERLAQPSLAEPRGKKCKGEPHLIQVAQVTQDNPGIQD